MSAIAASRTAVTSPGGGFYITVTSNKGVTTKRVHGDLLTVGRAENCGLSIAHEALSRRHLSVTLVDGVCWIEDHGSSNGTTLNGQRIKPHEPLRVRPEDVIELGQSGTKLAISAEPQMWKSAAQAAPEPVAEDSIVTTTSHERAQVRAAQTSPSPKLTEEAQAQAEKLVQEAQKKAATLIQEAEIDAERRVQDIYRRAHETQAKTDEIYQRRLNEAYRAAEKTFQKSQVEAEGVLNEARAKSAEIRAQAEGFIQELRRRTEEDCERILTDAQTTARELKENRLLEAEEIIQAKEHEVTKRASDAMAERLARFESDLNDEIARQREAIEKEYAEKIESVKVMKDEIGKLSVTCDRDRATLRDLEKRLQEKGEEAERLADDIRGKQTFVAELDQKLQKLNKEVKDMAKIREESKVVVEKIKAAQNGMDAELLKMRQAFEVEKGKLAQSEKKNLEEMKLETVRRIQDMERQLTEELHEKKSLLSRELALNVEVFYKENPTPSPEKLKELQQRLDRLFDIQISTLSNASEAKEKARSLTALKRWQKFRAAAVGVALGAVIAVATPKIHQAMNQDQTPMQRKMSAAAEERKQDLERRRFNPDQTAEQRHRYTDSVIYTKGYVETYLGDEFQKAFFKALKPFMFKTFRVEEDKIIQVMAMSSTLVRNLQEKRAGIHPDFVNSSIDKMRDLEAETVKRMQPVLGSSVRVDAYRRFERKFYETFVGTTTMKP